MAKSKYKGRWPADPFLAEFGRAMAGWSSVEVHLSIWFNTITGIMPKRLGRAIYFSGRSFTARSEMFAAALEHGKQPKQVTPLLKQILTKAISYASARNRLAHSYFGTLQDEEDRLRAGQEWDALHTGITKQELLNASQNFSNLASLITDAWAGNQGKARRGRPSPSVRAECLERLLLLPNEACSNELSQKQKGRLRQLQAAQRKARKTS